MGLLLDTCAFLWLIWEDQKLSARARELIADAGTPLFLSAVSIWEATSKHLLGKLPVYAKEPAWLHFVRQRDRHDIAPLPLDESAIRHLEHLPPLHRDPFDRLLICQAIEHGLGIVTPDDHIRQYPVKTLWD